ncbi:MAG TPA: hypothetical protein VED20_16275 [Streptosporangiaceae bacterium]|nr:hypothetical protein [Streptosporangiaceae bacterium]
MSKKTRPRRRSALSNSASTSASDRDDSGTLIERMLSSLWTAIAAGDPLRAELEAATCLSLPHVGRLDPDNAQAFISKVLVDEAVRRPSPEGAAMLRLLMTLGSPATKRAASQALAQLTEADIYPPDWVTEAGKPVPGRAWRRYDVFGDDEAIAVTFRYGEAEHGIVAHVDLTGIPIATAIGVAANVASLIEAIGREDDPCDRAEQIGLAEARRRLEAPLARCDQEPDPDMSPETIAYLPIARSRVRRLPAEDSQRASVYTAADRAAAVDEFLKSPLAAEAIAAGQESARFWAEVLTGYSSRIPGEPPAQIGPRKLAHVLLGHVPNTFTLASAQREHLEPAVTAWIRWSAAFRGLDEASTERLTEHLPDVFGRFEQAYDDPDAVAARAYLADLAASDADISRLAGHAARRMFAVPLPGPHDGNRPPDVGDPAARRALAEAEFAGCTPPDGMTSEQFVAAAHRVICDLWDDDPEATFQAARRMSAGGAGRHDIIHALAEAKGSSARR